MPSDPTTTYGLRLPVKLYEAIHDDARRDNRSVNYRIVELLSAHYGLKTEPPTVGGKRTKGQGKGDNAARPDIGPPSD